MADAVSLGDILAGLGILVAIGVHILSVRRDNALRKEARAQRILDERRERIGGRGSPSGV